MGFVLDGTLLWRHFGNSWDGELHPWPAYELTTDELARLDEFKKETVKARTKWRFTQASACTHVHVHAHVHGACVHMALHAGTRARTQICAHTYTRAHAIRNVVDGGRLGIGCGGPYWRRHRSVKAMGAVLRRC